jgi:hypothetical protein
VRFLDVWDLAADGPEAYALRAALLALAADPAERALLLVGADDIVHGRHGTHYVAPQSAYLMGSRRLNADLPPLR